MRFLHTANFLNGNYMDRYLVLMLTCSELKCLKGLFVYFMSMSTVSLSADTPEAEQHIPLQMVVNHHAGAGN